MGIHVGDVGTDIVLTVLDQDGAVVNLGTATTLEIIFDKPDGVNLTKTASLVTNGSDGKIHYVFIAGDLDQKGEWRYQARVVLSTGTWRTDVARFWVEDNL